VTSAPWFRASPNSPGLDVSGGKQHQGLTCTSGLLP